MKVILLQDIKGTGKKDQIIEAADGYARNYLIPRKLAVQANDDNLNVIRSQKAATAHKKDMERESALILRDKLKELTIDVGAKAGENGRLFGSVTTQEIAEALEKQHGLKLDKRKIVLTDPVKNIGPAKAEARLGFEVVAEMNLNITKL